MDTAQYTCPRCGEVISGEMVVDETFGPRLDEHLRQHADEDETPALPGIRLEEVDLSRGNGSDHPDIECGVPYLAFTHGEFFGGTFGRVWYGLTFDVPWGHSFQFDTPGTNSSSWKRLWRIVGADADSLRAEAMIEREQNQAALAERDEEEDGYEDLGD